MIIYIAYGCVHVQLKYKNMHGNDINRSNIFLDPSPKVMEIKTKINKWDLIKLKSFCTAKETISKMKRQPTEWEKIFVVFVYMYLVGWLHFPALEKGPFVGGVLGVPAANSPLITRALCWAWVTSG